jgi:hypothetical protein
VGIDTIPEGRCIDQTDSSDSGSSQHKFSSVLLAGVLTRPTHPTLETLSKISPVCGWQVVLPDRLIRLWKVSYSFSHSLTQVSSRIGAYRRSCLSPTFFVQILTRDEHHIWHGVQRFLCAPTLLIVPHFLRKNTDRRRASHVTQRSMR